MHAPVRSDTQACVLNFMCRVNIGERHRLRISCQGGIQGPVYLQERGSCRDSERFGSPPWRQRTVSSVAAEMQ